MAGLSNYWRNKVLSHGFGKEVYAAPSLYWVALSLTDPLGTGLGITEPSGGGYGRIGTASSDWNDVSSFEIHNSAMIRFPRALSNWGEILYFAIFDDETAGNMLAYGVVAPFTVSIYDVVQFDPNDLVVSL